jgi:hypothetical protein
VAFLTSLEESAFGVWVSTSLVGYPLMITLHAIGMAVMVGLSVVLDLRLLGWFAGIPYAAINRFLAIAWIGFTINLLSGTALFCMQATSYVKDSTFLLKMLFVLLGAVTAAFLQGSLNRNSGSWGAAAPGGIRVLAVASIVFWTAGMVMGRLIAYLV